MKTLYEDDKVIIQINTAGEVFVCSKQNKNYVRISVIGDKTIITTASNMIVSNYNCLPAIIVEK